MGAAAGSLVGGGFADALGRRASFMLCALPMLVGPLLSATATSLNPMVAGRFLAGVAIGLSSALVPLYISEVRALAAFVFQQHVCCCMRCYHSGGGPALPTQTLITYNFRPTKVRGTPGAFKQLALSPYPTH